MPKISCIMTTYNSEKYICDSIESILSQTFKDFEFIISDGGSKDKTVEIIKDYMKRDKRIVLLGNRERKNIANCLNDCIKIAKGEYIAIMESDDISTKDRFEIELNRFDTDTDIIIPGYKVISENGKSISRVVNYDNSIYKGYSKIDILFDSKLRVVDCMFKKGVIEKIGLFDDDVWDFFFQCNVFMNGNVNWLFIDECLYEKRENGDSYSGKSFFLKQICLARIRLIKKYNINKIFIFYVYLRYYEMTLLKQGVPFLKRIGLYRILQPIGSRIFRFIKL